MSSTAAAFDDYIAPTPSPVTGERAEGESYVPSVGGRIEGQPVPRLERRSAFWFKAHPERWQVIGGRVLPQLGRLVVQPGVGGAELDERSGAVRMATPKAEAEQRGWVIIPIDSVPPQHLAPGEVPSYLWRPRGRPDVVLCRYERAYPGSSVTQPDEKGWVEFLAYQIERGLIKPCPIYVLERMLQSARERLDKAIDLVARQPSCADRVAQIRSEIEVIEAEIASRREMVAPVAGESYRPGAA